MAKQKSKYIKLRESNVENKQLKSRYNKFQLLIAKWLGVELKDSFVYTFRIRFYGGRLKEGDVLANSENVAFVVIDVANNLALIMTYGAFTQKPKVYNTLTIVPKRKEKHKD
tara:strand:- start:15329 stop:15664 length:336 start_codon:yes stop_codon:yes gene_type:complete